jgi:hypothetical protein
MRPIGQVEYQFVCRYARTVEVSRPMQPRGSHGIKTPDQGAGLYAIRDFIGDIEQIAQHLCPLFAKGRPLSYAAGITFLQAHRR